MNKAIEELLEKIINSCHEVKIDHPFPDEPLIHNRPCHRCTGKLNCYVIEAIEALALLRQPPPAGEFTKCARKYLNSPAGQRIRERLEWLYDWCFEACRLLDAAEQEKKELKAELAAARSELKQKTHLLEERR